MKSHGNWQEEARGFGIKFAIILLGVAWLAIIAASWAEAYAASPGGGPQADDEYSFNWLDPDKKIYVLQNRKFAKAGRLLLSATAGPVLGGAYRTSYSVSPRAAFYFSEMFGVEAFFVAQRNSENSTFQALKGANGASGAVPTIRELRMAYGLLVHYVPWYAKINVFNKILYFDWYFSAGPGAVSTALDTRENLGSAAVYTNENHLGIFVGTGHQYHLTRSFTVRLDVTGAFYRAPLYGATGDQTWYPNYTFGLGIGYRL